MAALRRRPCLPRSHRLNPARHDAFLTEPRTLEFDPKRVRPLPDQPRKRFRGINELAASIAEVGQIAPGLVARGWMKLGKTTSTCS
jgi:hypothetical protein